MTVGLRLRHARRLAGLSLRALGARASVSAQAISKYERGLDAPGSAVLARLSEALSVRPSYLLGRGDLLAVKWIECRAVQELSKTRIAEVIARAQDALERYLAIEEVIGEDWQGFVMPAGAQYWVSDCEDAEAAAERLRDEWQLGDGPIAHVASLLESRGVRIVGLECGDGFDAVALQVLDGELAIALNTVPGIPGDRQRFTMCHELGHFVLEMAPDLDREEACNRFAGALLAPREDVRTLLGERRSRLDPLELHALKHAYGLSMQGWLHRAVDSNIISRAEYDQARASFRRLGWSDREPGAQVPPELPRRMEQLVGRAVAEGMISRSRAAELLGRGLGLEPV